MSRRIVVTSILVAIATLGALRSAHADVGDYTGTVVHGDFDGDGELDTAVSSPEATCGEGAVYVRDDSGTVTTWTHDTSGVAGAGACNNYFGSSLAVGDFDGDGYDDLAIGSPGYLTVLPGPVAITNAGAVNVLYGSSAGLTATGDQLWGQNSSGIADTAEVDDYFGDALTVGDFDCDGYDDLVIGAPREDMSPDVDSGVVHVLYGSSAGVSSTDDLWYQGAGGVDGSSESGDHFGGALAAGNFNADTAGGNACEDLAIASPGEDLTAGADAGHVYVIDGTSSGLGTTSDQSVHQNRPGVEGSVEANDHFGLRLRVFDDDGDAYADLEIAVPGDTCTPGHGMGRQVMPGSSAGVSTADDRLDCSTFGCIMDQDDYWCHAGSPAVHAAMTDDRLYLFVGDDEAWAGDGADEINGDYGDDVLFGGPGADQFHGGPGRDIQIGGAGDDVFIVDLDCQAGAGEIIDGGPGTDVVHSHLADFELVAAGVTLVSIESYVVVAQATGTCDPMPYEQGPFVRPLVTLSWTDLPGPTTVFRPIDDKVEIEIDNTSTAALDIELNFALFVGGYISEFETTLNDLAASSQATYDLDLNSFIPAGTTQAQIDAASVDISTSAVLSASARIVIDRGGYAGHASAPPVYGHIENVDEPVLYRLQARDDTYRGGDLATWRASGAGASSSTFVGIHEARVVDVP